MERVPITTVEQLDALDMDEVLEGYRDGFAGDAEPGDNRSFSYWHGWRNGSSDRTGTCDQAQLALARSVVRRA